MKMEDGAGYVRSLDRYKQPLRFATCLRMLGALAEVSCSVSDSQRTLYARIRADSSFSFRFVHQNIDSIELRCLLKWFRIAQCSRTKKVVSSVECRTEQCPRSCMSLHPTALSHEQTLSTGFANTVHRPWFVFLDLDVLLRPTRITPLIKEGFSG